MSVLTDREGDVGILTLDRPQALNSFNEKAAVGLREGLDELLADDGVRAILLTGAGERAFCTGADVGEFQSALETGDAPQIVSRVAGTMNEVIERIVHADKPIVAGVNGTTAGGGLGLALACDVRIASQTARFLTAFMNVAVSPDAGTTWLLPRTIGWARAREMILRNPVVDAKTALDWGLVTEVVPSDQVRERALEEAEDLASNPLKTMRWAKERLAAGLELSEHLDFEREATVLSAETDDFREGIEAFFDKRDPDFS